MNEALCQLARVVERIESKDNHVIDPVEFGEIKGAVSSLQTQVTDIKAQLASINGKQDVVIAHLSEARGGWKIMMLLGGSAGALGAAISAFFHRGVP